MHRLKVGSVEVLLTELNSELNLVNPLLGVYQNTPRGAVFLSDEAPLLNNINQDLLTDFDVAYIKKRMGRTTAAVADFEYIEGDAARIQACFCHVLHNDVLSLKLTLPKIESITWRHYFLGKLSQLVGDFHLSSHHFYQSLLASELNIHAAVELVGSAESGIAEDTVGSFRTNPSVLAAWSHRQQENGILSESGRFAVEAIERGHSQTDIYLTAMRWILHENDKVSINAWLDKANQFGISELRAGVSLAQFELGLSEGDWLYDSNLIKVVSAPDITQVQFDSFASFRGNLIHDGDASNHNGRYFSLNIAGEPIFADYFSVLKSIYESVIQSKFNLPSYDFIWSDLSLTTNSSNILNHLHTAGVQREYFYTAVTYPLVPNQIDDNTSAGYLRIGPPKLRNLDYRGWEIRIKPRNDIVIFFPSYFFHETIALPGQTEPRVSINTDFGNYASLLT